MASLNGSKLIALVALALVACEAPVPERSDMEQVARLVGPVESESYKDYALTADVVLDRRRICEEKADFWRKQHHSLGDVAAQIDRELLALPMYHAGMDTAGQAAGWAMLAEAMLMKVRAAEYATERLAAECMVYTSNIAKLEQKYERLAVEILDAKVKDVQLKITMDNSAYVRGILSREAQSIRKSYSARKARLYNADFDQKIADLRSQEQGK